MPSNVLQTAKVGWSDVKAIKQAKYHNAFSAASFTLYLDKLLINTFLAALISKLELQLKIIFDKAIITLKV